MPLSDAELVKLRDSVYRNPERLYKVSNTVRAEASGKNSFCVVHTDGTAGGVQTFNSQACHKRLEMLKEYTNQECIKKGDTFLAAIVLFRDHEQSLLQGVRSKKDWLQYADFLMNRSVYRNMFLVKDAGLAYNCGFMLRTDKHPDSLMRACTAVRTFNENRTILTHYQDRHGSVSEELGWVTGLLRSEFGRWDGVRHGHDPLGVRGYFDKKNLTDVLNAILVTYPQVDAEEHNVQDWYAKRKSYQRGFSLRFMQEEIGGGNRTGLDWDSDLTPEQGTLELLNALQGG